MVRHQTIFRTVRFLFILNIIAVLCFVCLNYNDSSQKRFLLTSDVSYKFIDPALALKILELLDVYKPLDLNIPPVLLKTPFLGLKINDNYCKDHRAYFVQNPEVMFREKNFISTYKPFSALRKFLVPAIGGSDIMPHVHTGMKDELKTQPLYDMRIDNHVFYFSTSFMREIGKQFSCLTQMFNHVPGHDNMYRKDHVSNAVFEYIKKFETRPQCFRENKYFPKTLSLRDEQQCRQFFDSFNSQDYQELKKERKIVYFRKIGAGVHKGKGVFPVDDDEERDIRSLYQNGTLCGKIKNNNLMQYYIYNPLLINGRMADFRAFLFIASTNPLIVYYNDGYFSISLPEFDIEKNGKEALLTNSAVALDYLSSAQKDGLYGDMDMERLWKETIWSFREFQEYLLEKNLISDPNWLDNYFRPEIQKLMIHLIRLSQDPFRKHSSLFEIFRLDIMIDTDFNLWFLEANANPDIEGFIGELDIMMKNFLMDSFDVLFGLLRSRTKRIINYVNELTQTGEASNTDGVGVVKDLDAKREKFEKITRNYFEPEFVPQMKGNLVKIVDENLEGLERYSNLLTYDCL